MSYLKFKSQNHFKANSNSIYLTLLLLLILCSSFLVIKNRTPTKLINGLRITINNGYDDGTVNGFIHNVIEDLPIDSFKYLKYEKLYKENILKLLNGSGAQRSVAYELIYRVKDTAYYDTILNRMDTDRNLNNNESYRLAILGMQLFPQKTTMIFEFIMKNESFGDVIWTPTFLKTMDTKSILATAYSYIDDKRFLARILAMSIIAKRDNSNKADELLLNALATWDRKEKGYIIYNLQDRKKKELWPILEPYTKDSLLHEIACETLLMSDIQSDTIHARYLCTKEDVEKYRIMRKVSRKQ